MSNLQDVISRLERVIKTGATDKDGMHPVSAEIILEELTTIHQPVFDRWAGEWIHDRHFGVNLPEHKCSICGEWEYSDTESNYCPHCGARMKGAEDEDN